MSLTTCPECTHTVSDKALSCPSCGYPMVSASHHPAKQLRHRLPNGYGSIKKLSGNRTHPYAVYPPSDYLPANPMRTVKRPALGYFSDWNSAYRALITYHSNPYDLNLKTLTFAKVYRQFFDEKFTNNRKTLSDSSKYAYETAFKHCSTIHNVPFSELRKADMQQILDKCSLGYSTLCNLKKLFCQLYRYALENDIVQKNYAQFVTINKEDDNEKGDPFSQEELDLLWANKSDKTVQMILMLIYSGYRIAAFETIEINLKEGYFKGGVKTAAGKGRIVPIHPAILSFVKHFRTNFPNYRARTFRTSSFYPTLKRLGLETSQSGKKHTPHDCRHTFSWLCDKYNVDELSKHLLMGHSLGKDVEKSVYGHRTYEELRNEINKIQI